MTRTKSACLLSGLLFDDAGHRMVPTHATKNRVRYRYYVSQPHLRGGAEAPAGSVSRVPASDIEAVVSKALAVHLGDRTKPTTDANRMHREIVTANVARIEVRKNQLAVRLKTPNADAAMDRRSRRSSVDPRDRATTKAAHCLLIPWCKPPSKKFREILLPPSVSRQEVRPDQGRAKSCSDQVHRAWPSLAGRDRLRERQGVEQIAARHKCSVRHVNMTISMAFIAPALVKAAVEGRLPRGIGVASLRDAPAEWSHQLKRLGLAQRP